MTAENKLGPKQKLNKNDTLTKKTFIMRSKDIYNMIPRQLTLLKNHLRFKKCLKKYTLNKNIKFIIPQQDDFKDNTDYVNNFTYNFCCP